MSEPHDPGTHVAVPPYTSETRRWQRARRPAEVAAAIAVALLVAASAVAIALLLIAGTARAQTLSADSVLQELEARARDLHDITFLLEGELRDEAGQRIAVEIEVMAIPSLSAASLYIIQPDALADNMVVLEGEEVRNYTFLTHQVALYDSDDPEAFGGLFPEGQAFALDLDLGSVFEGWDVEVSEVEPGSDGDVYTLRFDNLEAGAAIHHVMAVIDSSGWLPVRLVFYASETELFADLRLVGVQVDAGLDVHEVTWIPQDAEVLDRRR